jgi:hypothetical protein
MKITRMYTSNTLFTIFALALPLLYSCVATSAEEKLDRTPEKDVQLVQEEMSKALLPQLDTFTYKLPWLPNYLIENKIINRIFTPIGYERVYYETATFGHWLRHLPLKEGHPQVYLYNGQLKGNQSAHAYVMDIDIGDKDLQQCADATMRLRAEYLFSNNQKELIRFNYTNGADVPYSKWRQGFMPVPEGKTVKWVASSKAGEGYDKFKSYMIQIFNYAGTLSLSKELATIKIEDIQSGDLFIKGGSPGHAVIIVDMATHLETGDKLFLLAQSYMPAQHIQILKNPSNPQLSPWYSLQEIDATINTPEWTFERHQVMRWN